MVAWSGRQGVARRESHSRFVFWPVSSGGQASGGTYTHRWVREDGPRPRGGHCGTPELGSSSLRELASAAWSQRQPLREQEA